MQEIEPLHFLFSIFVHFGMELPWSITTWSWISFSGKRIIYSTYIWICNYNDYDIANSDAYPNFKMSIDIQIIYYSELYIHNGMSFFVDYVK